MPKKLNRTEQIRTALLTGEPLDRHTVIQLFGVDGALLSKIVREMKKSGYRFSEEKTARNRPTTYRLVRPRPAAQEPAGKPAAAGAGTHGAGTNGLRAYDIGRDLLLEGQHVSGTDLAGKVPGAAPQAIGAVVAQLRQEGYEFDYEMDGRVKRWFITGKGEPKPRRARALGVGPSRNGHRPRMPAPQIDAPTECVMVFRVTDDEVQFAVRQGPRVFTAQLLSVAEAE